MTYGLVVGLDGSDGAQTALRWALAEARLRKRAVRLITVWPEDEPPHVHDSGIGPPSVADFEQDVRARMHAEATEVAAAVGCDTVPVHAEVRYGQPAEQLVDAAGADGLLVVGSRGRGSLRGAVLGSVSQQCVQYARGPVVVVRDDESTHGAVLGQEAASRVLVGVDGSPGSAAAIRFGLAEACLRGGELHLVHAWIDTVSGYGGPPWAVPKTTLREEADDVLRQGMETALHDGPPGVQVRAETVEGVDWDVLTELAEAADLLVVGSRGRTGWSNLLLGSVGLRCVTFSPCPVAVVRPALVEG
jgi:nucleotide-binding universal stress UspA family protein